MASDPALELASDEFVAVFGDVGILNRAFPFDQPVWMPLKPMNANLLRVVL